MGILTPKTDQSKNSKGSKLDVVKVYKENKSLVHAFGWSLFVMAGL